jgi:hypothetical protein
MTTTPMDDLRKAERAQESAGCAPAEKPRSPLDVMAPDSSAIAYARNGFAELRSGPLLSPDYYFG